MYTLDDHAAAKTELEVLNNKYENYSGNNPNRFRADIETAKAKLHSIESHLKSTGELPRTLEEERDIQLDLAFPNAQSRQVVEWQGKRYMRRFTPVARSLSGKTVKGGWHKYWEEVRE